MSSMSLPMGTRARGAIEEMAERRGRNAFISGGGDEGSGGGEKEWESERVAGGRAGGTHLVLSR